MLHSNSSPKRTIFAVLCASTFSTCGAQRRHGLHHLGEAKQEVDTMDSEQLAPGRILAAQATDSRYSGSSVWTERKNSGNGTIQRQKIFIAAFLSFTPVEAVSSAIRIATGIVLDNIMSDGALLPDYEIEVDWYDDRRFEQAIAMMEAFTRSDRKYLAVIGPRHRMTQSGGLAVAAHIPQLSFDTSAELSDRSLYPSLFRSVPSKEAATAGQAFFMKGNGWSGINFVTNNLVLLNYERKIFDAWGIQPSAVELGEDATETWGEFWQRQTVNTIRKNRVRIIRVDGLSVPMVMTLFCYLHQNRIRHMVYFADEDLPVGFWNYPWAEGPCQREQFDFIFHGYLMFFTNTFAPGMLFKRGAYTPPLPDEYGGSLADVPLTCQPSWTASSWFNDDSHLLRAFSEGLERNEINVRNFLGGAPASDNLCSIVLMLHEAIYERNMSLSEIETGNEATYLKLMDIMPTQKHFGLRGEFEMDPRTGAVKANWIIVMQPNFVKFCVPCFGFAIFFSSGDYVASASQLESVFYVSYKDVPQYFKFWWPENGTVPDISLQNSILGFYPDCTKINGVLIDTGCFPCSIGSYYDAVLGTCRNCTAGFFQDVNGQSQCKLCTDGTFASEPGSTSCKACSIGTRCAKGSAQGEDCPPGSMGVVDAETGIVGCARCPLGRYQADSGKSFCAPCDDVILGSTTVAWGAVADDECICPAQYFLLRRNADDTNGSCKPCLEGTACPGGLGPCKDSTRACRGPLLQDVGFHAGFHPDKPLYDAAHPDFIVECASKLKCPGGSTPEEGCPLHREGLACDICEVGYIDQGLPACVSCAEKSDWYMPLICVTVVLISGVIGLYLLASREVSVQSQTLVTLALTCSLIVNVVQTLGAFKELTVDWIDPMKTIAGALALMTFRIDILNFGCLVDSNSPALQYLASLLVYPAIATILTVCLVVTWYFGRPITRAKGLNIHGVLYMVIYLALSIVSVLPWQCAKNPYPSDTATVVSFRTVECFKSSEHIAMMILSIIGFLFYAAGFVGLVVWATVLYPREIMQGSSVEFVQQFQLIFSRFTPHRYYYGVVYVTRNLFLALFPVIFVNEPQIQLIVMMMLIVIVAFLQQHLWPWKTSLANLFDSGGSLLLITTLTAGSMLIHLDTKHGKDRLQILLIIGFTICSGSAAILIVCAVLRFLTAPKEFGVFLSHHKGGAAVLARWMKEVMTPYTSDRIFIDSDELDRLDLIFSIVAFDTKNVVVLLTAETLRRMWCAGEIATAVRHHVNIVLVACDDYEPPDDGWLLKLGETWTSSEKAELYALGVDVTHISTAYRELRLIETLPLQRKGNQADSDDIPSKVIQRCRRLRATTTKAVGRRRSQRKVSRTDADIVMIGDTDDVEVFATCQVIQLLLQRQVQVSVACLTGHDNFDVNTFPSAFHLLVVLSRDVLRAPSVAFTLIKLLSFGTMEVAPLHADQTFVYPNPQFWRDLAAGNVMNPADLPSKVTLNHVEASYRILFTKLSLRFSPHGSNRIQRVEINDMIPKLGLQSGKPQKKTSSTSAALVELLHSLENVDWDEASPCSLQHTSNHKSNLAAIDADGMQNGSSTILEDPCNSKIGQLASEDKVGSQKRKTLDMEI